MLVCCYEQQLLQVVHSADFDFSGVAAATCVGCAGVGHLQVWAVHSQFSHVQSWHTHSADFVCAGFCASLQKIGFTVIAANNESAKNLFIVFLVLLK
jgi:hypothetical protein